MGFRLPGKKNIYIFTKLLLKVQMIKFPSQNSGIYKAWRTKPEERSQAGV